MANSWSISPLLPMRSMLSCIHRIDKVSDRILTMLGHVCGILGIQAVLVLTGVICHNHNYELC